MSVRRRRCLDQSLVVSVPQPRGSGANLIQIRRRSGKRRIENQKHSSTREAPIAKPPLGNLLATVCLNGKPNDSPHEFPVRFSLHAVDQLQLPRRLVTSQARTGNSGRRNSKKAERTSPIRKSNGERPEKASFPCSAWERPSRRSAAFSMSRRDIIPAPSSKNRIYHPGPDQAGEPAEPVAGRLPDFARGPPDRKPKTKLVIAKSPDAAKPPSSG